MDNKQAAVDAVHMERMEDKGQERGSGSGKADRRCDGPVQSDCAADEIVCVGDFRAAWSFDKCDAWKEFAKKYNMDVKMVGYERGMLFSQIKTIYRDGTIKDEIKEFENYNDWMWNATLPNNGG